MQIQHGFKDIIGAIDRYSAVYKNYWKVMFDVYICKKKIKVNCRDGYKGVVDYSTALLFVDVGSDSKGSITPMEVVDFMNNHSNSIRIARSNNFLMTYFGLVVKYRNEINEDEIISLLNKEEFPYKDRVIKMHGIPENGAILDVFVKEDYSFLNVNNEVVIDVGANIADSAIYFAVNGAQRVVALEPFPYSYLIGKKNIEENNLEGKIELVNAGYGNKEEISIDGETISNGGSQLTVSPGGTRIKLYSLKEVLKDFDIDIALLKMDCEGCEYDLLTEDDVVLRRFKRIQLEYHYGHTKLKRKLRRAGFKVSYSNSLLGQSYLIAILNLIRPGRKALRMGYLQAELVNDGNS